MIDVDAMWTNHLAHRRKYINDEDGIESNDGVHCPHCDHFEEAGHGLGEAGVYCEGDHDFNCQSCGAEFHVESRIEYTWVSTKA